MNKVFFRNLTTAFRSAGWLMIGTGLIISALNLTRLGVPPELKQWGYGSFVVGGCFLVIDVIISYLTRDKA